jgi:hypothetical protein
VILFIAHIAIIISSALMRLFDSNEKIVGKTSKNNPLFLNNNEKETAFSAHFREINKTIDSPSITPFEATF